MSHISPLSFYNAPVLNWGSITQKECFVIHNHQFHQWTVRDKMEKLMIFGSGEVQGITVDNKTCAIRSELPKILTKDLCERYLPFVCLVLSQTSDGEYVLKANGRMLGGGNTPSSKKAKGNKPQPAKVLPEKKVNANNDELYKQAVSLLEAEKYTQSVEILKALVSQDYAPAFYMLSQCYLAGLGVAQDIPNSVNYLVGAAERDYDLASRMLGWSLTLGCLVSEDYEPFHNLKIEPDYVRAIKFLKQGSGNGMLYESIGSDIMVMTLPAMVPSLRFDKNLKARFLQEGWGEVHLTIVLGDFHLYTAFVMRDPMVTRNLDTEQRSLFHVAAGWGRDNTVFLEALHQLDDNSLKKTDRLGYTPLHFAAWGGNVETFKWLIEKDKTVLGMKSSDGSTIAHMAAKGGHSDILKIISTSAKPLLKAPNKENKTPLDLARQEGHEAVASWLGSL